MAFVLADRVKETTIVVGTGAATLLGAQTGYQSFSAGVGASNTTYYTIADQSGSNWEVGYGTLDATGLILTRTTVLSSSNSGSAVSFTTGTKDVWCDYTAKKAVIQDSLGTATVSQLATNATTSTTPVLSFNASNSNYAAGATISGSYLQTLLQNKSNTAGASTNYVLSNDLGTDSTYYGEFGMNSSVFSSSTPSDFYSINNGIYFSGHDGDISVGSGNGYKLYFPWGSTGASAHVINASGAIGLSTNLGTTPALSGTTGYGTAGYLMQTQGSSAAPTWVAQSTLAVGTSTNLAGGNNTTLLGALPYQSNTNTTSLLSPNTTTTKNFLVQTGTGTNGAAPVWGTIAAADVPTLNQNTTGTAANITATSNTSLTSLANLVTVGTITSGTWSGSFGAVSGANLTSLNGSNISSGTVAAARLGSGTPSSSNYLRGDGTWSAVSASPAGSNTQVQYNSSGSFAGSANFTFDGTNVLVAGTVSGGSDERLKKNWRGVVSGFIEKLSKVKAGIFDRTDLELTQPGVSAQSLREVLPEAVLEDENGMLSVNYGGAALLSVVELAKEVVALRAEIEALKAK